MAHEFCPYEGCKRPIMTDIMVGQPGDSYLPCPNCNRNVVFRKRLGLFQKDRPTLGKVALFVIVAIALAAALAYLLNLCDIPLAAIP